MYLPVYGVEVMDDAAASSWKVLGYNVKPVQGLAVSSMYGGALRCSVKVLKRPLKN